MIAKKQLRSLIINGGPGSGKCAFGLNKIEVLTREELDNLKAQNEDKMQIENNS